MYVRVLFVSAPRKKKKKNLIKQKEIAFILEYFAKGMTEISVAPDLFTGASTRWA